MNKMIILFFTSIALLNACAVNTYRGCKPVLMPYVEYGYKAKPWKLSNAYVQKKEKTIDFHGVKIVSPHGFKHEIVFDGSAINFYNNKKSRLLLSFENNKIIQDNFETFNLIGCNNFNTKPIRKNSIEFYSDLYSFTDDQLNSEPDFWQYYVLWAKTKFLRDAVKLTHYTGNNIEAFQRNFNDRYSETNNDISIKAEVFPKKMAPDYLVIVTNIKEDEFIIEFIEMMNAMNP